MGLKIINSIKIIIDTLGWEIISLIGAFVISLITWSLNERSKRIYEEYKRKEEKYSKLIRALRGFYTSSFNKELRDEFLNQLNLCWMYCPDDAIIKAYNFLSTVDTNSKSANGEREKVLGEFMLSIRKDLIKRKPLKKTSLKPEDFKHLKATEK
jgi:Pyruvate/2-oxoacid:ferredoxin oxidoreductase delta subunit